MPRVLITGGSGVLGRELAPRFAGAAYDVRLTSRTQPRGDTPGEWVASDLLTGEGLGDAVAGADLIIHAASSAQKNTRETDVNGTMRLLEAAKLANTPHLFYISIVGIELIPFGYYRAKLAAEKLIEDSGVPYSILRATQFHTLLDMFLRMFIRFPVAALPRNFKFQPIDAGEVAEHILIDAARGPSARLPDLGGPEVLTAGDIAAAWLKARNSSFRAVVLPLPLPGKVASAFRAGYNCTPNHAEGKITWADWLGQRYSRSGARGAATLAHVASNYMAQPSWCGIAANHQTAPLRFRR